MPDYLGNEMRKVKDEEKEEEKEVKCKFISVHPEFSLSSLCIAA
jgi:hypothetical protein